MSAESLDTYINDPVYQTAMQDLQNGKWEAGLNALDQLVAAYPVNHQLRLLRQEMKLRAQVDEDERLDSQAANRRMRKLWGARILFAIILVGLLVWGTSTYSSWIGNQVAFARQTLEDEVAVMEMAVKFRDAQDFMQVGRLSEAKLLFEEVAAKDPEYPGLADALAETEKMIALEQKYDEALRKINLGEMTAALELLEQIEDEEPFFKDVSTRTAEIKGQFFLADILAQAEKAYEAKNWKDAAAGYETLRALNPVYQADLVEEHMFNAYMSAAVEILSTDTESLVALNESETYFRKALSLRPQDPVIRSEREQARQSFKDRLYRSYMEAAQAALADKADSLEALTAADQYFFKALELRPNDAEAQKQRDLAHTFIEAQGDFSKNRYNQVIDKLEVVVLEDADYASGTARQTLYEAYIARGDAAMLSGDYEQALGDFQRSAILAEQGENTKIRLFQAQILIAEAKGALLQYEDACLLYRSAIDAAEFQEADLKQRPDLVSRLKQADNYLQTRSYRSAYRVFRDQARKLLFIFPKVSHVVESGEYLTMIASRYHTTVDAILAANSIGTAKSLAPGQELIIPVQP